MSVPPPPPTGPPGGFFGGPVPPPVAQYGYAPPAPAFAGYAPAATFGAPQQVLARPAADRRVPELVTIACTLLGVFAAIGVFTVIAVLDVGAHSNPSTDSGSGVSLTSIGVGAMYGLLWGGSGFINAAMVVLLRQGNAAARLITSAICGLWTLYWLKLLWDLSNTPGADFFGPIVHLGELLMLGLAVASALPAVLLWRPSAAQHFS